MNRRSFFRSLAGVVAAIAAPVTIAGAFAQPEPLGNISLGRKLIPTQRDPTTADLIERVHRLQEEKKRLIGDRVQEAARYMDEMTRCDRERARACQEATENLRLFNEALA